eukprot:1317496-Rhodomonas_salina.1
MLEQDGPAFQAIRTQLKLHPPTSWLQVWHLAERAMSSSLDNGILPTPGITSLNPGCASFRQQARSTVSPRKGYL